MLHLRAAYHKTGRMRFLSHLDLARTIHRALSRAGMPIAFSEGFNPQPRVAFGPPVSLGLEALEEWVDLLMTRHVAPSEFLERMNAALTEGIGFSKAFELSSRAPSLGSVLRWAEYRVEPRTSSLPPRDRVDALLSGDRLELAKRSKKGDKIVDVRPLIRGFGWDGEALTVVLACGPEGTLSVVDLMVHLTGLEGPGVLGGYRVVRTRLQAEATGEPLPIDRLPSTPDGGVPEPAMFEDRGEPRL